MYYQPITTSFTSFTRYSDRYKDVLDRALRDKNLNQSISMSYAFEKQDKPAPRFCFIQIRSLGIGAFSSVYLVSQQKTGSMYAMKVISRSTQINHKDNLIQQIKVHLQLKHPNIATLYHIYNDEGSLKLIMEYAQFNLMTLLKQKIKFSQKEASLLIAQILEGIKYIHSKGITHRDMKLQNILLVNGVIKICDFGLARKSKQFESDDLVGTIDYLSPQIVKQKRYNHKTDIWAIGVILWELLYGASSFLKQSKDSQKYSQLINLNTQSINYYGCSSQLEQFFKRIFVKQSYRAEAEQLLRDNFIKKHEIRDNELTNFCFI